MKIRNVHQHILRSLGTGKLHFSLLDPEKLTPTKAGKIAKDLEKYGTDAIMLGGSTTGNVDNVCKAVSENTNLPIILFPNGAMGLSGYADAVFFMSLLNSNLRSFLVGEQIKGARLVSDLELEAIGMGYIVINTGAATAVEKVAQVQRLTKEEVVSCALASQYFGMKLIYLEAGSGAQRSVPDQTVQLVKSSVKIPVIVGGGINGPETALRKLRAGADIIVTGTVIEKSLGKAAEIIDAVKTFDMEEE